MVHPVKRGTLIGVAFLLIAVIRLLYGNGLLT
jgi:hypothetical protein